MRKNFYNFFLFLFLFILNFSVIINAQNHWSNIGPGGGSDLQTVLIQPDNSDVVYLGGDIEGIFKTTNGGETWEMINNNMASGPWTPDVYWTNQFQFDKSDNSFNSIFYCCAIGLFKSVDGGKNWELLFPQEIASEEDLTTVFSIAQDPNNFNNLFVGTAGKGVYKSTNAGVSWSTISIPMSDTATVFNIVVTPNSEIFLGTSDGLYFSPDLGTSWENRSTGLPHKYIWNLKYVNNKLFVSLPTFGTEGDINSFSGGIYMSTDKANTWNDITSNLPKMQSDGMFYYYWKFTVNPLNTKTIYIGTSVGYPDETLAAYEEWGIYKTMNGGASWQKVDNNVTEGWMDQNFFDERHALVLAMAPSDTNRIYWGRDWIYRTTNAGESWEQIYTKKIGDAWQGNGFELMMTEGIAFSPINSNDIFIGYDDMGLFRSTDGGISFKPLDPKMDPYDGYDAAKDIFIDPNNGDIYLSRYDGIGSAFTNGYTMGRIYKSTDDGNTFVNISNGFPDGRPYLTVDFTSGTPGNRTLYATSFTNGVYKSTDGGNNWFSINNGLGGDAAGAWVVKINPDNSNELYLGINNFGGGGALYKSTDAGASWFNLSSFPAYDVLSIEIDNTNNVIYCGATENYDWSVTGGLFKSTDEGNTWSQISDLPRIADITINPNAPSMIFIASQPWYSVWLPDVQPGIFKSTDSGNTWQNVTDNLNHDYVLFTQINPNNTSQLFVGTGGGGLWVSNNLTEVKEEIKTLPTEFKLYQNYPNPFNPTTTIEFSIPDNSNSHLSFVNISLYNSLGEKITTLVNAHKSPGFYRIKFNGTELPSGIYFYKLTYNRNTLVKKMILLK